MDHHWNTLIAFVVSNLPTDIHARRAVLNSVVATAPQSMPRVQELANTLADLDRHLTLQRELSISMAGSARLGDGFLDR